MSRWSMLDVSLFAVGVFEIEISKAVKYLLFTFVSHVWPFVWVQRLQKLCSFLLSPKIVVFLERILENVITFIHSDCKFQRSSSGAQRHFLLKHGPKAPFEIWECQSLTHWQIRFKDWNFESVVWIHSLGPWCNLPESTLVQQICSWRLGLSVLTVCLIVCVWKYVWLRVCTSVCIKSHVFWCIHTQVLHIAACLHKHFCTTRTCLSIACDC